VCVHDVIGALPVRIQQQKTKYPFTGDAKKEGTARTGSRRGHGLLMHAQNRIPVLRGIVEGHPAAHSGAAVRAILDHF